MSEVFVSTARKRVRIAFQQEGVTAIALPVNVRLGQRRLRVVTIARQGLPGADGAGVTFASESLEVTDPDDTTHILTNEPQPDSLKVYLNGLREDNFEVTGSIVDFAAISYLTAGDKLTFDYAHGV